ncbi:hypothetical protein VTN49DRAFT_202 [Thermomyces lanuginosus]|uniref:uncharacterized protein n=1 Tax=Thermomyces lanuginosus TaxID=5541 RepID=UPI003744AF9F
MRHVGSSLVVCSDRTNPFLVITYKRTPCLRQTPEGIGRSLDIDRVYFVLYPVNPPPSRGSFILEYERMKRIQNPPAREPGRWHRIRPTVFLLRERRSSDQWITPSTVVNQSAGSGCAFSQNAELHHGPEMLLDPEMSTVKLCRPTMVSVSTVHGGNEGWTHVIRMAEV